MAWEELETVPGTTTGTETCFYSTKIDITTRDSVVYVSDQPSKSTFCYCPVSFETFQHNGPTQSPSKRSIRHEVRGTSLTHGSFCRSSHNDNLDVIGPKAAPLLRPQSDLGSN
ncbi:hypothetical protein M0804_000067 [Polistes exclamans]|nr:hypothetical protein M0804_000067 [Polistes exclamans]